MSIRSTKSPGTPDSHSTLPVIGRVKQTATGLIIQVRQHPDTLAFLHRLTQEVPEAQHLRTETKPSLKEARRTGQAVSITLTTFILPGTKDALHPLMRHAQSLRTAGQGRLIAVDEATRTLLRAAYTKQPAEQSRRQARQPEHQTHDQTFSILANQSSADQPDSAENTESFIDPRPNRPTARQPDTSDSPEILPISASHPDIQILTGRNELTANQAVALRIRAPRHPQSQEHLYNGWPNEGLYDRIMTHAGARYVKGTKGGRSGQGARAGYFRVPITTDTTRLIGHLQAHYGLTIESQCPTLDNQTPLEAIRARLRVLADTYRLSTTDDPEAPGSHPGLSTDYAGTPIHIPKPDGLDYLPYQKAGIYYAVRQGNALIADEPGLGKTIQAIGTSNALPQVRRVLIIPPASLKINWEREWKKWCTKGLRVDRVSGGKPENWPQPKDTNGDPTPLEVVILNFDLVEQHYAQLTEQPWDMLIVDEAHALKSRDAKRTKAILGHGNGRNRTPGIPAKRTLLLTGTPILSRPAELWTLAHALDPDYFSDSFQYERRYCNGHTTDYGWNARGASNLKELQRELRARIMVRRRKSQVLKDLPPKTRQLIELDHPSFARAKGHFAKLEIAANTLRECFRRRGQLDDQIQNTLPTDTDALARYRQQAEQLEREAKVAFFQMSEVRKETALMKVPQVMDLAQTALANGKLILFCHHGEVVEAYKEALEDMFRRQAGKRGTPKTVAVVTGKTPNDQRQKEADRFQEDPDCQVFIGTIQAAGTGLTLTEASAVLFAELDWVPGNVTQAEDRAHRIGQLDHVLIYHAVIEGTLDALMVRRLIEKQAVIDSALDESAIKKKAAVETTPKPPLTEDDRLADWLTEMSMAADSETEPHEQTIDLSHHTQHQGVTHDLIAR